MRIHLLLILLVCVFAPGIVHAVEIDVSQWQGGEHSSGKLPVMYINTENGDSILDKENYLDAGLWIDIPENCPDKDFALASEADPVSLKIRGRGNATWLYPKKPYKLKFTKKTKVLGMPKHKHFALLATYGNMLGWAGAVGGMELARLAGLSWTPHAQPVELVLNGTYEGLYWLFESIKIDENRLDIYEQPEENTDPSTIPYGWLVEIDNYDDEYQVKIPENPAKGHTMRVTHKSPVVLSDMQRQWLIDEFTSMCQTIYGDSATAEGWTDYIEPNSLVQYYIVCEVMTDLDGFNGSLYMYRDIEGDTRWHFGPMWDCNLAVNNDAPYWVMDNLPNWSRWKLMPGIRNTAAFREVFMEQWPKFYPEQYNKFSSYLHDLYSKVDRADYITWQRWGESYSERSSLIDYFLQMLDKKAVFMNEYYEELVKTTAAVEEVVSEAEAIGSRYFTLDGVETPLPTAAGIYIKSTSYTDGTIKNTKIVVK